MQERLRLGAGSGRVSARTAQLAIAIALGCGAGCSSSKLVDTWTDSQFSGPPLANIFVISDRRDPARRALWEDGVVTLLGDRGVAATACHRAFPDSLPTEAALRAALRAGKFDGLLSLAKPRVQQRERYVAGNPSSVPETVYGPFFGGYATIYRDVYAPGYTETETTLRIQVNVYRATEHESLVWSTTTETLDPSSPGQVSREVSQLIVPALSRAKIIP